MSCLEGRYDTVAVLGTGGGKSLGWQVVAKLFPEHAALITVPYTALLEEQKQSSRDKGIVAEKWTAGGPALPAKVGNIFLQPESAGSKTFKT
jgi:superfamily II DNA helicase RecQ